MGDMASERDPRLDPRPGDKVMATIGGRSIERDVESVKLGATGGFGYLARDITYTTNLRRGPQKCWISTWQDWCHKNKAEVLEKGKDEP